MLHRAQQLRPMGRKHDDAWFSWQMGAIAIEEGQLTEARTHTLEAVRLLQELLREGATELFAKPTYVHHEPLWVLGGVAAAEGSARRALVLTGAATSSEPPDLPAAPATLARLERWLEPARRALSWDEATAAFAEGEAMTPEQAIAYARQDALAPV